MSGYPLVNCGSRPNSRRSSRRPIFECPSGPSAKRSLRCQSQRASSVVAPLRQSPRKHVRLPDCSQSLVVTCRRKGIDYFRKNIVGDVIEKLWHCAEFLAAFRTADHHDTLFTLSDALALHVFHSFIGYLGSVWQRRGYAAVAGVEAGVDPDVRGQTQSPRWL